MRTDTAAAVEDRTAPRATHEAVVAPPMEYAAPAGAPLTGRAPAPPPDQAAALLRDPRLGGRANGPVRSATLQRLQASYGNHALSRLWQQAQGGGRAAAAVQRTPSTLSVEGEEDEPIVQPMRVSVAQAVQRKPDVPALTTGTETTAKALLGGSAADKQAAINAVVKDMVKSSAISLSKLDGKKVYYDAATVGEGLTNTTFKATGGANPSKVTMGDAAFSSLSWLYSSILHEYQHVKQHQALKSPAGWSEDKAEVEAYTKEILKSEATGVYKNKANMEELWKRLHDNYWVNITDKKQKKELKSVVTTAHDIAEKATGKKLTFTP